MAIPQEVKCKQCGKSGWNQTDCRNIIRWYCPRCKRIYDENGEKVDTGNFDLKILE